MERGGSFSRRRLREGGTFKQGGHYEKKQKP
nr:MAG TPA: hypothetical protein [Caudoviricetes sp.]